MREMVYAHAWFHVTSDSAVNMTDMVSSFLSLYGGEMFIMNEGGMFL